MSILTQREEVQLSFDLTELEQNTLHVCEEVIERNLKAFVETGEALATIRDGRLYRATYKTFEEYCLKKWNLSRPYAYELMDAAEIAGQLSGIPDIPPPANPAQALALKKVPEEERQDAWKEAVETAPEGKMTAAHVEQVVKARTEPEAEPEESAEKCSDPPMTRPDTTGLLRPVAPDSGDLRLVDNTTVAALFRAFSPELLQGRIAAPVLVGGRLYVTQTKDGTVWGDEVERGNASCLRVVEMDWWIDHQEKVIHADVWWEEVNSGKRTAADLRGLRVFASGVKSPATVYYVLTGESVTFRCIAPVQNSGKSATAPKATEAEDNNGSAQTTPDGAAADPITLREDIPPSAKHALLLLGTRLTEVYNQKQGCTLSKKEVASLHEEVRRLLAIETAYTAIQKPAHVEVLRDKLVASNKAVDTQQQRIKELETALNEALEQVEQLLNAQPSAAVADTPTGESVHVTGRNFQLLTALASRKRPGQEETPSPADYLSLLIEQRANMAGIELPDEGPRCFTCKTELSEAQTLSPISESWIEQSGTQMFLHEGNSLLAGKLWYCPDCAPNLLREGNHLSQDVLKRRFT